MKKNLLLLIVLATAPFLSRAQSARYGFTGGFVNANYVYHPAELAEKGKARNGFTAGVLLEVPVSQRFAFQPAINFVQKGTSYERTFVGNTETISIEGNYIEVPLNILIKGTDNKARFFIGAGPCFAMAVSGKWKMKDNSSQYAEALKFGSGENDFMKGFDLSANFLAGGYFTNGLLVSFNCNRGLSNLLTDASGNGQLKSNSFGIRLGYLMK